MRYEYDCCDEVFAASKDDLSPEDFLKHSTVIAAESAWEAAELYAKLWEEEDRVFRPKRVVVRYEAEDGECTWWTFEIREVWTKLLKAVEVAR